MPSCVHTGNLLFSFLGAHLNVLLKEGDPPGRYKNLYYSMSATWYQTLRAWRPAILSSGAGEGSRIFWWLGDSSVALLPQNDRMGSISRVGSRLAAPAGLTALEESLLGVEAEGLPDAAQGNVKGPELKGGIE